MSKSIVRKTYRKCVLCRHWNGSIGSTTIEAKMGNQLTFDTTEKQSCFKKGVKVPSTSICGNFEARYK